MHSIIYTRSDCRAYLRIFSGLGDTDRHGDVESRDRPEEDGDDEDKDCIESSSNDFRSIASSSACLLSVRV